MSKYQIIYADPPWGRYGQFTRDRLRGNDEHYPLMGIAEIKALPVADIADEDCVLFLWAIDTQLADALETIQAWGFTYRTVAFTWVKETKTGKDHFGVGGWTRKNPEMCLLATRGRPKRVSASVRQLQRHKLREHSRKPDEIRGEIVRLCGDVPRAELFCRFPADGWDVWGNEVASTVVMGKV